MEKLLNEIEDLKEETSPSINVISDDTREIIVPYSERDNWDINYGDGHE